MAELAAFLDSLPVSTPPDADPIAILQNYLDSAIFPDFTNGFWYQVVAAIVCLSLVILANLIGLAVRAARGRLQFIIRDGSCTRIDWRTGIPILWSLEAVMQIVLLVVFRHNFRRKSHDTRFFGACWALVHMTLVFSYTLLTLSVLASSPPIRRALSRLRHGPLVFNGSWLLVSTAMLAALVPFGLRHGDAMRDISRDYNAASDIIQAASASGDISLLANLPSILQSLGSHNSDWTHYRKIVIGIYNLIMVVLLMTGILPSIWLVRSVKRKISQLDSSPDTIKSMQTSSLEYHSQIEMEVLDLNEVPAPSLPTNAPFSNLEATTLLPPRFEVVLQDRSHSKPQRAERLRILLRKDIGQLSILLAMELSFFAICLFWFFQKDQTISPAQNFELSISYVAWNFLLSAMILSAFFLYESIFLQRSLAVEGDMPGILGKRPVRQYTAPDPIGISCTQVVAVNVDKQDNLKEYDYKGMS